MHDSLHTPSRCDQETEIYSRVTGYHRPLKNWNAGKQAEFSERKAYSMPSANGLIRHLSEKEQLEMKELVQNVVNQSL